MSEHTLQTKLSELRETVERQSMERACMLILLREVLSVRCIELWIGKDLVGRIRKIVKECEDRLLTREPPT
jgi:hypothetical protein